MILSFEVLGGYGFGGYCQSMSSPCGGWSLPPILPHMSSLQKRVLRVAGLGEVEELMFHAEGN